MVLKTRSITPGAAFHAGHAVNNMCRPDITTPEMKATWKKGSKDPLGDGCGWVRGSSEGRVPAVSHPAITVCAAFHSHSAVERRPNLPAMEPEAWMRQAQHFLAFAPSSNNPFLGLPDAWPRTLCPYQRHWQVPAKVGEGWATILSEPESRASPAASMSELVCQTLSHGRSARIQPNVLAAAFSRKWAAASPRLLVNGLNCSHD
jgi:hypothetical protein